MARPCCQAAWLSLSVRSDMGSLQATADRWLISATAQRLAAPQPGDDQRGGTVGTASAAPTTAIRIAASRSRTTVSSLFHDDISGCAELSDRRLAHLQSITCCFAKLRNNCSVFGCRTRRVLHSGRGQTAFPAGSLTEIGPMTAEDSQQSTCRVSPSHGIRHACCESESDC